MKVKPAFTLIELLVIIAIISLLIGAATISWATAQKRVRDAKRKADLSAVQSALELYLQTYDRYPTSSSGNLTCSGGAAGTGTISWGGIFQCPPTTGPIFMQKMPKDPTE